MKTNSLARTLFTYLLAITALLVVLHVTLQYFNLEVYKEKQGQIFELSNRVDFDDEVSLPTWFSQFLLLSIGVAGLVTARFEVKKSLRRLWKFIGVAGILMAIDEVGSIHEFVLQTAHLLYYGEVVPTAALNAWWLMLPFIAIGGVLLIWWIYRNLPRKTVGLFIVAGIVYLSGAAGFELISNDFAKTSFIYQGWLTAVEESLEMIGSIMALCTIINYLETEHTAKLLTLRKLLRSKS